jgi:hypothetical protein
MHICPPGTDNPARLAMSASIRPRQLTARKKSLGRQQDRKEKRDKGFSYLHVASSKHSASPAALKDFAQGTRLMPGHHSLMRGIDLIVSRSARFGISDIHTSDHGLTGTSPLGRESRLIFRVSRRINTVRAGAFSHPQTQKARSREKTIKSGRRIRLLSMIVVG